MVQNRTQNDPKSRSEGGLGGFWAALGPGSEASLVSLQATSWAVLGRFLKRLERFLGGSWAVLGTKLGRLGGFWRHLGGVLVGSSHQNGAKLISKPVKSCIFCHNCVKAENLYLFYIISMIFDGSGIQVRSKNRSWGVLEASWRCLRESWRHLGASWGPLGAS